MARISARIRCEIEVEVGVWDGTATFDDLREQVRQEGLHIAQSCFENRELREVPRGRVVGTPRVLFVVVEEEEKV